MADPYQYITSTGVIVPDTQNIYAEVQNEFLGVFGADTIITPDTPQGVLATALALSRAEEVQNNAAVANQINPNVAGGVFLDAIMAFTGQQRTAATKTVVSAVTVNGVSGTVLPIGTQAATAVGDLFETLTSVTLASGTGSVDFRAVDYGPVPCDIGALSQIVSNVNGWETVDNATAGVLGQNTQSDQAARAKRNNTLAFQGVGLIEAITSALYATEGVTSLWAQENVEATTQTINAISMVAHSIYVCVNGGSDVDVAGALLENKSLGCAWNGGTSVTVTEPSSGQDYVVKFDRPATVEFLVRVTTPNGSTANIKTAILDWMLGTTSGTPGLAVGTDVSPFEIAPAINSAYSETYVNKVEITLASSPTSWATDVIAIAVNQIAFTTAADITVITP